MFANEAEVKNFFRNIRKTQIEILNLKEMYEKKEFALLPQAIRYDREKVQTTPIDSLFENEAEMLEIEGLLKKKLKELGSKKTKGEKIIERLENPSEREVLRLYYFSLGKNKNPMRWEDVAAKCNYTMRHTLRLHSQAIENILKMR